jgi:hypothetical protein
VVSGCPKDGNIPGVDLKCSSNYWAYQDIKRCDSIIILRNKHLEMLICLPTKKSI